MGKNEISLLNHYKNGVIVPAVVVLGCQLVGGVIYWFFEKTLSREWMPLETNLFSFIILSLLNSMLIGVLCYPIFLNNYRKIRYSCLYRSLSWFFLPFCWMGFVLSKYISFVNHSGFDIIESLYIFSNTLPYLFALIYTYSKFLQEVRKELVGDIY